MKNILLILLSFLAFNAYAQAEFPESVQLTNVLSTTAPFVNVQTSTGIVNKINKADLIEYLEFESAVNLPVTGVVGKLYLTKDNNLLYRWNGTVYTTVTADVSGKENTANKQNSLVVDGTGVKFTTVDAVNSGLATKQNTLTNPITGTLTTGTIPLATGSNTLGNSVITQSAGGFIGIGTTTGLTKFNVIDEINTYNSYFSGSAVQQGLALGANSSGLGLIQGYNRTFTAVNNIAFQKDGGNLLVGTIIDNTIDRFQVNGTITATPATLSNQVVVKSQLDTKQNTITGTANVISKFGTGGLVVSQIFDDGNNVGIGTNIPSRKLSIAGTTTAYQSYQTASNIMTVGSDGTGQFIVADDTAGVYRWVLKANGNTIFGATGDNLQGLLQVNGNITASSATLSNQVVVKSQLDAITNNTALTGVPTAPTATVGTNTTQVATTAFVATTDAGNVKLTGNQTISGTKTFDSTATGQTSLVLTNSASTFTSPTMKVNHRNTTNAGATGIDVESTFGGVSNFGISVSTNLGTAIRSRQVGSSTGNGIVSEGQTGATGFVYVGQSNGTNTYTVTKEGAVTGTSFINTTAPATNALLANGTTIGIATQLKDFFTDVNNVGITETDLYNYTTVANRLNTTGEKLVAVYGGTFNDATASSQLKIYYQGLLIGDTGALTMSVTGAFIVNVSIMRTGANNIRTMVSVSTPGASTASYTKYTTFGVVTFANANVIKITGTASGATGGDNDITTSYGNILWQPAAL